MPCRVERMSSSLTSAGVNLQPNFVDAVCFAFVFCIISCLRNESKVRVRTADGIYLFVVSVELIGS